MHHPSGKIPIPLSRRWREVRIRLVPLLTFVGISLLVAWLWKERTDAATMSGHVIGVQAEIRSPESGTLAQLSVRDFDRVETGDIIGMLVVTDPSVLQAELAVVLAEIELLRLTMDPVADQQRNMLNYTSLQMDLAEHRAQLAMAQLKKNQARNDLVRLEKLLEEELTTPQAVEQARTELQVLAEEVATLAELVTFTNDRLGSLPMEELSKRWKQESPLAAAISVQQRMLDQIKAERMPRPIRAPVDGQIMHLRASNGSFVDRGDVLMQVYSEVPDYILAWIWHPVPFTPQEGMQVLVRRQHRGGGEALMEIEQVGVRLEVVEQAAPTLVDRALEGVGQPSRSGLPGQSGLPVRIALSGDLDLRPGEVVHLRLMSQ